MTNFNEKYKYVKSASIMLSTSNKMMSKVYFYEDCVINKLR